MPIEILACKSALPFGLFFFLRKNNDKKTQKKNKTVTKVAVTFTVSLGKNRARVHLPGEDGHGDDHYLVLGG